MKRINFYIAALLMSLCIAPAIGAQGLSIGSGTTFSLGSSTLSLIGDWSNAGTFTAGSGAVVFYDAIGNQTIANASGETFFNVTVNKTAGDVQLLNPVTVMGTLTVTSGDVDLNGNVLTLGSSAMLSETPGNTVKGTSGYITTTRDVNAPSSENIAGMGATITSGANLGSTTINRGHAQQTGKGNVSILRYFDIIPANNTGLNATLVFNYDASELNALAEANLILFKSIDNGASWINAGGTITPAGDYLTKTGVTDFSRWTLAASGTPLSGPPDTPVAIAATGISQTGFSANWNAATGATGYCLDVATSSAFTTFVAGFNNKNVGNVVTYNVTGLSPGIAYYYRVRANNIEGTTVHSNTITAITPLSAPVATPATAVTDTSFTANWNASSGAAGYYLDVATNASFTAFISGFNNRDVGNVTTFPLAGLTAGVAHYYRVRAYSASTTSTDSNTIPVTTVLIVLSGIEGTALDFTEGSAAVQITNSITLSSTATNLAGGAIEITGNYENGADVLGFTNQNGITGSWDAAAGRLTLSGSSAFANYRTALRTVQYGNTGINPSALMRTISFTVHDGTTSSNTVSRQIHFITPGIDVQGNGISIADGDTAPGSADGTDFGNVNMSSEDVTHTFMIRNTGTIALNLTGTPRVVVSGANAADFTVTAQPASPVAPGGSATFQVTFHPSASGLRTATISIANNDPNESPYDFAIQGNGNEDSDYDGTPDAEEQGPDATDSAYDGNSDGTPDWQQSNVISFHTNAQEDGSRHYLTLSVPSKQHLGYLHASSPFDAMLPEGISFPYGFFSFTITGVQKGGATTATLYLDGTPPQTYYKYGKTPDNPVDHWYEFAYDGQTGAEVAGHTVVLHFVDGKRGDHDLKENGSITDPGGPAEIEPHAGLYFPYLVSTGEEKTEIGIINTGNYAATSTISYYGEDGALIKTAEITLGPRGKATIAPDGIPQGSAGAIVSGDGKLSGYTRYVNAQGKRCAWPAATRLQKFFSVPHTAVNTSWATGLSLFNPNDEAVEATLTYDSGATGQFTLNAKSRRFIWLGEAESVSTIHSTGPVSAMEIFDGLTPGGDNAALLLEERSLKALYLPWILYGSGEFTGLALNSYYSGVVSIFGHDAAGGVDEVSFGTEPLGSQGSRSKVSVNLSGLLGVENVWAEVYGEADVSTAVGRPLLQFQGLAIYGKEGMGKLGAVNLNALRFRDGFLGMVSGGSESAVALLNPNTEAATINVTGYNADGEVLASHTLQIAPGSNWTGTMGDLVNGVSLDDVTHIEMASDLDLYGLETIYNGDRIEMIPVMSRE